MPINLFKKGIYFNSQECIIELHATHVYYCWVFTGPGRRMIRFLCYEKLLCLASELRLVTKLV